MPLAKPSRRHSISWRALFPKRVTPSTQIHPHLTPSPPAGIVLKATGLSKSHNPKNGKGAQILQADLPFKGRADVPAIATRAAFSKPIQA